MKNRPFAQRLGFALAGLVAAFQREHSLRTHIGFAALALLALLLLQPAPYWWALVGITIAAVIALELVNSAIESVIDLLHPGLHPEIRAAKDMLAGAVLVASIAALLVALALVVDSRTVIFGWFGL